MRQLNVKKLLESDRDLAFEKLKERASIKQLSREEEKRLLIEIKNGNLESIEKLVDSWEIIILSIAQQIPTDLAIEEMLQTGKEELNRQLENAIDRMSLDLFRKFALFCIKQEMMKVDKRSVK